MDSVIDSALIQAGKDHVAAAQQRKGEKPKTNPSRKRLEFDFAKQPNSKQGSGPHLRFIRPAYPPCTTSLDDLEPIGISDLRLETHHTGKVLFVTVFGHAQCTGPILNAVEDQEGKCGRLAVYNFDHSLTPAQVLPKGSLYAIKEPFFELPKKDEPLVRVDHPSDLVKISDTQKRAVKGLKDQSSEVQDALKYKDDGNGAFKNKDYLSAVELYSESLDVCKDEDQALRSIALRNRAIVNLHLHRYEAAASDARASLTSGDKLDEKVKKSNATAHFRAGRAEYQLGNVEEALKQFEKVLELTPKDADAEREMKRTKLRIKEQQSGDYDFKAMSKAVSPKHNRLDHTTFTANVEVRQSSVQGNGLFAVKDIPAGDLILCEKALSVAYESDATVRQHLVHNFNTDFTVTGPKITLQANLVQKMLHNRCLAKEYLECYDAGYEPKCKAELVDGMTAVDAFQTMAIIEGNAFACPTTRSSDLVGKSAEELKLQVGSVGFWVTAAYINSACDGNARRSFIGDMMSVRATRDIAAGEEILSPYVLADADNAVTQQQYQTVWGFTCACHICTLEAQTPAEQRKHRQAAIAEVKAFFEKNPPASPSKASILRAERLFEKTEKTYDAQTFKDSPRLALVDVGTWLCRAYQSTNAAKKLTAAAEALLRDLGFVVQVDGQKLRTRREFCHLDGAAIEAAMRAAHAYRGLGKRELGNEFERLGRELYVTMHGEARGFGETYGAVLKEEE